MEKDKMLKLYAPLDYLTKEDSDSEDLYITGYASTTEKDRASDVIIADAWKKEEALSSYLKNPIVLAYHDHTKPIGKTVEHSIDSKGLKITAKISKAAKEIKELILDGILSAFSVGFMVKDADYDSKTDMFVIKEVELLEISVVAVPANQSALFSLQKNFETTEELQEFKNQYSKSKPSKETLMKETENSGSKAPENPIDLDSLKKELLKGLKADLEAEKKAADAALAKEAEELKKLEGVATTAAERLIADVKKQLEEDKGSITEILSAFRSEIKALSESGELEKEFESKRENKMEFSKDSDKPFNKISKDVKHGLVIASKLYGRPIKDLKGFDKYVTKSEMNHWDSTAAAQWEEEYSTTVENDMRAQLVVENLFKSVPMRTPQMTFPINPEAGYADWVHPTSFRGANSTGSAVDHEIHDQTINAYKLATKEYLGYEEEEDSIVALAPIIRDAVARRMALASDLALLRGGGVLTSASYDPILGLVNRGGSTTDVECPGGASWASSSNCTDALFAQMRQELGIWGLNPADLVLLVSHDLYYTMMQFAAFKTMDVLGDKATIITGQVGSIWGMKVVVSQTFDNAAITAGTVGTVLATLVRPSNFMVGSLRGVMTESDKDIEQQKRILVSSRRFGFVDIISGVGSVNLVIAT